MVSGRFPGEHGVVAPGLSCQYPVKFAPDSLADYDDVIKVTVHVNYITQISVNSGLYVSLCCMPKAMISQRFIINLLPFYPSIATYKTVLLLVVLSSLLYVMSTLAMCRFMCVFELSVKRIWTKF